MDGRAIGVFDSGVGGLSAVKVLEHILPREDIVYFGDSGRMPYGGRTRDEICSMSAEIVQFLSSFGVKAMLIACGTITSNAADYLRSRFDTPFFGVVDEAAAACCTATRNGRVGVIATAATVRSGAYTRAIHAISPETDVIEQPCPPLAAIVEEGHFRPGDTIAEEAVREQLAPLHGTGIDTLLLGCTHYPLLSDIISAEMGENVRLVSAAAEAACGLRRFLCSCGMLSGSAVEGARRYYTSGDLATFTHCAELFLGHGIEAEVHTL